MESKRVKHRDIDPILKPIVDAIASAYMRNWCWSASVDRSNPVSGLTEIEARIKAGTEGGVAWQKTS